MVDGIAGPTGAWSFGIRRAHLPGLMPRVAEAAQGSAQDDDTIWIRPNTLPDQHGNSGFAYSGVLGPRSQPGQALTLRSSGGCQTEKEKGRRGLEQKHQRPHLFLWAGCSGKSTCGRSLIGHKEAQGPKNRYL